jgi:hypothetical protein
MSPFEIYLRTGRVVREPEGVELKFNPWHDPDDGRFTFAGQGRYFGSGGTSQQARPAGRGDGGASGSWTSPRFERFDPKNPANHSIYRAKRGDTLTSIAARRHGLRVADLAWLNGISVDATLHVGQRLKLPHQSYLDAGRDAKNNFLALADYIDANSRLPPNSAHAPIPKVVPAVTHAIVKNGYRYEIDSPARTIKIAGGIHLRAQPRSKREQANAGRPDRRSSDDGGHFIAARFNGPRDWFNHFAQDANFNRGAYRVLEDRWAKAVRQGKRVFVDITPMYNGASRRPYKLVIRWIVNGEKFGSEFPNERQPRKNVR